MKIMQKLKLLKVRNFSNSNAYLNNKSTSEIAQNKNYKQFNSLYAQTFKHPKTTTAYCLKEKTLLFQNSTKKKLKVKIVTSWICNQ